MSHAKRTPIRKRAGNAVPWHASGAKPALRREIGPQEPTKADTAQPDAAGAPVNGITSVKLVPIGPVKRVTSPSNCFESALTMRVPRRLLVSGLKSAGRPTPSSRTDIKIDCRSVCSIARTWIRPPVPSG